jgi:hypothetical protein
MICPECGSEYREGFTHCNDCDVDLVEPQADPAEPDAELVSVYKSGNPALLPLVESLLRDAQIEFMTTGQSVQALQGAIGISFVVPVEFWVRREYAEQALELLADVDESQAVEDEEQQITRPSSERKYGGAMICPECGSEYRAGFTHCNDCDVDLVEPIEGEPDAQLTKVWSGTNPAILPLVESLLDEAEIPFMKRGESIQDFFAGGRMLGLNPVVGPVEFWVRSEHAAQALELLSGVDESHVVEEEFLDEDDSEAAD